MDLHLKDKTVIVTGASEGLGKAIATEYAREGAQVFISSRSEEKLQKAVEEIKANTGNEAVKYIVCDMCKDDHIRSLVQKVAQSTDSIDVLINNAGGPRQGSLSILQMINGSMHSNKTY